MSLRKSTTLTPQALAANRERGRTSNEAGMLLKKR
jgi:hypothetical protein